MFALARLPAMMFVLLPAAVAVADVLSGAERAVSMFVRPREFHSVSAPGWMGGIFWGGTSTRRHVLDKSND